MNIRQKLIDAGVKNLREYGYSAVNSENIITDPIYRAFFKSILEQNIGQGFDGDIKALIKEVEK